MRYSEDLIEEIRMKNDIVDVISGYVKLNRKGSSYFGLCPFHNEKSPSFSVSPDKQMYYCFGCGAGGNVYTFIQEYENYTFPETLKFLAERAGVELPSVESSREAREQADLKTQLLMIHKLAAQFYFYQLKEKAGEQAYHYLRGRELTDETIVRFGLGYSVKFSDVLYRYIKSKGYADEVLLKSGLFQADEKRGMYDKFWNRVMFPIMDAAGRVIGFGGRVMGDGKPKYLNSPETPIFDKSRNLYGLNIARTSRKKNLIICEGYMDVIAMHQAGFNNAVASLGTALTAQQANLIKRYAGEALLIYDSDEAGQRAALRAIPLLREAGVSAKVIDLSPYKDPDECIKEEGAEAFWTRLENGRNGFMFQVTADSRSFDLQDPQGQSDFFHSAARMLLEFEDEIERTSYLEAIAREYKVKPDMLQRLVNRLALKEAGVSRAEPPKSGQHRKQERENGYELSQKLLLTWMVTYPAIFDEVTAWISPEDFTTPLYHKVAEMLFEQHQNGDVNPARLLNAFSDSEEQRAVAAVFNAQLPLQDDAQRVHALWDVICRMKESSIAYKTEHINPADMEGLMRIMEDKRKLEDLKGRKVQLHISFD